MNTDEDKPAEDVDAISPESESPVDQPSSDSEADDKPTADSAVDEVISSQQDSPTDALSRTPEDLAEEKVQNEPDSTTGNEDLPAKKTSKLKKLFKKANLYFLLFMLVVAIASIIAIVSYLNSQKEPVSPTVANQELDESTLKQLANTDASVGNKSQTLTIQGNAIIDGQTLSRGNLNVAGNFQTGGNIQGPTITVSGAANLGDTQINTLQVASNTAIQGGTTMRDLNVSGTSSFGGAMTASQITVTRLIMSGNAVLEVPNHIAFTGPSPGRTVNHSVLGSGGSASVSGSDTTGTININTGNSPATGCFIRINFSQRYSGVPHVIISPVGYGAGKTEYYVDRDQNGFSVCSSSPAPANQAFAFDYFITG